MRLSLWFKSYHYLYEMRNSLTLDKLTKKIGLSMKWHADFYFISKLSHELPHFYLNAHSDKHTKIYIWSSHLQNTNNQIKKNHVTFAHCQRLFVQNLLPVSVRQPLESGKAICISLLPSVTLWKKLIFSLNFFSKMIFISVWEKINDNKMLIYAVNVLPYFLVKLYMKSVYR